MSSDSSGKCVMCGFASSQVFDGIVYCNSCFELSRELEMKAKGRRPIRFEPPDRITQTLLLGNEDSATNKDELKKLHVSRIVVAGSYLNCHFPDDFEYKVLKVQDSLEQDLTAHFDEVNDFIDGQHNKEAVNEDDDLKLSRCLLHCAAGISRSGAFAVAYLLKHNPEWSVDQALQFARTKRPQVHPNSNFMRQLEKYKESIVASSTD